MKAVADWKSYLTPEELRYFLDRNPGMKERYYEAQEYMKKFAPAVEKERNDPWLHFEQGTPEDPLIMGYAGSEYAVSLPRSKFRAAQEQAYYRAVFQKMEGVRESGAFATFGRAAGGFIGWVSGRDVLESSEIGADIFSWGDVALGVKAGQVARSGSSGGGGVSSPPPVTPEPPAYVAPKPDVEPAPTPGPLNEPAPAPEPPSRQKPPVVGVTPPAPEPDPKAQLMRDLEQAEQRYQRLQEKASRAETDYAKSLRPKARAMERRGQQPTQQETDLLATKRSLEKARDEAEAKRDQLKQKLQAEQPKVGVRQHGEAGLAQESKYLDELRARGLQAELTDKNTPVIDAAIKGNPEVHSVKSLVPAAGTDAAVRLAEGGSPRELADRVSAKITEALMDRRSAKWSLLQNRWNTTMRGSFADRYGYELPKNPDDISFVVDVRVITNDAPSGTAQQAVEAAVTSWLKKNERVPPNFSWRIVYVNK
jgi:hypothetical protein